MTQTQTSPPIPKQRSEIFGEVISKDGEEMIPNIGDTQRIRLTRLLHEVPATDLWASTAEEDVEELINE